MPCRAQNSENSLICSVVYRVAMCVLYTIFEPWQENFFFRLALPLARSPATWEQLYTLFGPRQDYFLGVNTY